MGRTKDERDGPPLKRPIAAERDDAVRAQWRAKLKNAFPHGNESLWREQEAWSPTWDQVALPFREVSDPVQRARRLEEIGANLRRRMEMAFVYGDADDDALRVVERLLREADLAFGLPRSPERRRRLRLMQFVDECAGEGLKSWPDFARLAEEGDTIPCVPPEGMDGEWRRVVHTIRLRAALDEIGDVSHVPVEKLDALVHSWSEKKPGAKKVDGRGAKKSAYVHLRGVLKLLWDDETSAATLKKEWSEAKGSR